MLVNKKENIFGDEIAYVEQYDFSRANLNDTNRLLVITTVASICYQNPKGLGSESLYNRLAVESMGLPSSSFEFVPVLLDPRNAHSKGLLEDTRSNVRKFGEWIVHENKEYLLTNYRSVYYDYEAKIKINMELYSNDPVTRIQANELCTDVYLKFFNTEAECEIIKKNFFVFLYKVDFPTRSQMVRHRVNWQELSRRYVSGERVPFDFYISEKMDYVISGYNDNTKITPTSSGLVLTTEDILDICLNHYYAALAKGIKPQEARRIIPQAAYTQIWGAFQSNQLANYFKLRLDEHAQWEIRQTAIAMKELIDGN